MDEVPAAGVSPKQLSIHRHAVGMGTELIKEVVIPLMVEGTAGVAEAGRRAKMENRPGGVLFGLGNCGFEAAHRALNRRVAMPDLLVDLGARKSTLPGIRRCALRFLFRLPANGGQN